MVRNPGCFYDNFSETSPNGSCVSFVLRAKESRIKKDKKPVSRDKFGCSTQIKLLIFTQADFPRNSTEAQLKVATL